MPEVLLWLLASTRMSKATAIAPVNIALIKYWGKKNPVLRLPENNSIAVNQSNLTTTTTVEFSLTFNEDRVVMNTKAVQGKKLSRAIKHLDRIRERAGIEIRAKVVSQNNFPTSAGLASSASGFAALTLAGAKAAGLDLSEKELSILARQGSGSACRSVPDGFVEWNAGESSVTSYAHSLYPPDYWDLAILAVVVEAGEKDVSSTEGHQRAGENPFLQARLARIDEKIKALKSYLAQKDFQGFGELVEAEALELHAIMLTSTPSLLYWLPATIRIMRCVKQWREEGMESYFTIDAGPHLHIVCRDEDTQELTARLKQVEGVKDVIVNQPAKGARLSDSPLF